MDYNEVCKYVFKNEGFACPRLDLLQLLGSPEGRAGGRAANAPRGAKHSQ